MEKNDPKNGPFSGGQKNDSDEPLLHNDEPDSDEEASCYNDAPTMPDPTKVARVSQEFNENGTLRKIIKARKSAFVHNLIYLDGAKFSFEGREYLLPIYDRNDSRILLKTARQVEKSTALTNHILVKSVVQPYNKSLYVSPSHTQTRQFSSEKLKPAIERSPFIMRYLQDSQVSNQVFEKGFTNGSFIFLRSAFRSADRARGISARDLCLMGSTTVFLEDGRVLTLEELIKQGPINSKVLTLNEETYDLEYDRVVAAHISEPRRSLRVTSMSGSYVDVTDDHPVLTWDGWKKSGDLTTNDFILEVGEFSFKPTELDMDKDDAFIAGCMLGDGTHISFSRTNFYTCNGLLKDAFTAALTRKNASFKVGSYPRDGMLSGKPLTEHHIRIYGGKDGYKSNLMRWGIIGQRTKTKCVTFFNKLTTSELIAAALNGFIATDGYISSSHKPERENSPFSFEIGYVTTSPLLAQHVQLLWRKLGVYALVRTRDYDNGVSKAKQFIVQIRDKKNVSKAAALLNVPNKQDALFKIRELLKLADGSDKACLVPLTNIQLLGKISEAGLTLSAFREKYKRNLGKNNSYTTAAKVRDVAAYTDDPALALKVSPWLIWQKITAIEEIAPEVVYDITMEKNHNFFANTILVHNCIDETQDFYTSEIPVIRECTSHFKDSTEIMAGTPKSHDNPLEVYWQETTQNEWLVPCSCGKWNFLDEQCIAPTEWYLTDRIPPGPVCKKCLKPIDVRKGKWMSTSPGKSIQGYRIPQLMVPWIVGTKSQWLKLLWKRDNYPFGQFYNEVLGLSYDSASKPITRDELIDCCDSYDLWNLDHLTQQIVTEARGSMVLTAGVDWGEGNDGSEKSPSGKVRNASYTVLTLGAYINQRQWAVKAVKKYVGKETEPDYVVADIVRILNTLGVALVGVDWGHGWGVNNSLVRKLGPSKVIQYQYLPKLKQRLKWDPLGYRYHLARNFMLSELFFDLKNGLIRFPRWQQIEPYAKDILAVYAEYNEYRREVKYDHRPSDPDDFLHSLHYARLTADIYMGKSRRYTANVDTAQNDKNLS